MFDELIYFEFIELDYESRMAKRISRQERRENFDPFEDFDEEEFIKRYRLTKDLTHKLCEDVEPYLKVGRGLYALTVEEKVLTAISFYANGSYQRPTGENSHSLAQQTVSQILADVTDALNAPEILQKYIYFPKTLDERNANRKKFYEKFKFPGVLGCIGCTHVAIIRPNDHPEHYQNRKQNHSLNVQLICDADLNILSVDSGSGGANHDAFIWDVHPLKQHMEELNETTWFLGDSGYALRSYMLTPIVDAAPDTPQQHYTNMHVHTRNTVERTIGLLKARFRCLLAHRRLYYQPHKAASIINACVVLHNICNRHSIPVAALSKEEMLLEAKMQESMRAAQGAQTIINHNNEALQRGVATRDTIVACLWDTHATR